MRSFHIVQPDFKELAVTTETNVVIANGLENPPEIPPITDRDQGPQFDNPPQLMTVVAYLSQWAVQTR
jgi:hypothetical protein